MPPAQPTTQDDPDPPGPDEPDSSPSDHPPHAPGICVDVVCHTEIKDTQIDGWLDQQVCRAIALCEVKQAQLNLVIVADEEMAQLHEQYTGVAGTTDVLTFDLAEGGTPSGPEHAPTTIEADIILCLDEARRQAAPRGHEPRHEVLLYAIHGLMHLLGEDDHDDEAYQRMHAREDALLQLMGFAPLFNSKPNTPDPRL